MESQNSKDPFETYQEGLAILRALAPEAAKDLAAVSTVCRERAQLPDPDAPPYTFEARDYGIADLPWFKMMIADPVKFKEWQRRSAERNSGIFSSWIANLNGGMEIFSRRKGVSETLVLEDFNAQREIFLDSVSALYEDPRGKEFGVMMGVMEQYPHRAVFSIPEGTFPGRSVMSSPNADQFQVGDRFGPDRLAYLIADRVMAVLGGWQRAYTDDPIPEEAAQKEEGILVYGRENEGQYGGVGHSINSYPLRKPKSLIKVSPRV